MSLVCARHWARWLTYIKQFNSRTTLGLGHSVILITQVLMGLAMCLWAHSVVWVLSLLRSPLNHHLFKQTFWVLFLAQHPFILLLCMIFFHGPLIFTYMPWHENTTYIYHMHIQIERKKKKQKKNSLSYCHSPPFLDIVWEMRLVMSHRLTHDYKPIAMEWDWDSQQTSHCITFIALKVWQVFEEGSL